MKIKNTKYFVLILLIIFSLSFVLAQEENQTIEINQTINITNGTENVCGDGTLGGIEECDDGNLADGDGCSSSCFLEEESQDEDTNGQGEISPGGTAPIIEYSWILPDEDPNSTDNKSQLNVNPGLERTDIYSCFVASDNEGRDSLRKGFVKVYHPDGTFKYQAHATQLDPVNDEAEIRACISDAVAAGLITEEQANSNILDIGIIYNIFEQPNWHMYKVYLPMYYHQPAGMYKVAAWVTDQKSSISSAFNETFEWVPGTYLALDFDTVSFGSIEALSWKNANGDTDMAKPQYPTLKNNGNTEIDVDVEFSDFVGEEFGKVINDFDAQLRSMGLANDYNEIEGEHLFASSNEIMNFTWPIELCRQEKIDFSIHADSGMVPDRYAGNITIYATGVDTYSYPKPVNSDGEQIIFDGFHELNALE